MPCKVLRRAEQHSHYFHLAAGQGFLSLITQSISRQDLLSPMLLIKKSDNFLKISPAALIAGAQTHLGASVILSRTGPPPSLRRALTGEAYPGPLDPGV
jgi:hypothetical protein